MYSNCLIEAIKAKIKDPKNVHIFKAPKEISNNRHWMWTDDEYYYHASIVGDITWYNYIWHEIKMKRIEKVAFEAYVVDTLASSDLSEKLKVAKKLNLKIFEIGKNGFGEHGWDWSLAEFQHDELPTQEQVDYFTKVVRKEPIFKVVVSGKPDFVNYKGLQKLGNGAENFRWRWVDIYDEDFGYIYSDRRCVEESEIE